MITRLFLFLLLLLAPAVAYTQRCVIANERETIAYIDVPNPLIFAVEGLSCGSVELSTTNGQLKRLKNTCSYEYYPANTGRAPIVVKLKNGKTIDTVFLKVLDLPAPVALVAGKAGGTISKRHLAMQIGVAAQLNGFDFDAHFQVTHFNVSILRDGKGVYSEETEDARFSETTRNAFGALNVNDLVLFTEITCKSPGGKVSKAASIEFKIVE
jgi:hypothetical protein